MSYRIEPRIGTWGIIEEQWQDTPNGLPLRLLAFRMKQLVLGHPEYGNWGHWHHVQGPIEPKEAS